MSEAPENIWQFLLIVFNWFDSFATRTLGVAGGTIAILNAYKIIPDAQLKYYVAAAAILTYWRGQVITTRVSTANAILASQPTQKGTP